MTAAAEISPRPEDLKQDRRLKYLEFVRVTALWAVACLAGIYCLAKAFAGPLRPGVEGVECAVAAVAGPIYDRLRGVPLDLLRFADGKVDALLLAAVPPPVRDASRGACAAARSVAVEARRSGVVAAAREIVSMCEPAARGVIARYEPAAERRVVAAWRSLNRIPMFPMAAQVAVHVAACWIGRYNRMVEAAVARGFAVASVLPLVPLDRIAKVFGGDREESPAANGGKPEVVFVDASANDGKAAAAAAAAAAE